MNLPPVINGWTIVCNPLFVSELEKLIEEVGKRKAKDPKNYLNKNSSKRLRAVLRLAFEVIPEDPTRKEYRQGDTLGEKYKHWYRATFFQQYRLFFRYHDKQRIIAYGWVNNEDTKRAYESSDDAYRVFSRMLSSGNPPDDWEKLVAEAKKATDNLVRLMDHKI